jgi:hypothetical protein
MIRRPPDLATLRAAWWALRAIRAARRGISRRGVAPVSLPAVPYLPGSAERGVTAALRRTHQRCLVRATVLQAWYAAHGQRRDLIIGVTAPGPDFQAHAWLAGNPPCHSDGFRELLRRPAA